MSAVTGKKVQSVHGGTLKQEGEECCRPSPPTYLISQFIFVFNLLFSSSSGPSQLTWLELDYKCLKKTLFFGFLILL